MSDTSAFQLDVHGATLAVRGELTFDTAHAALTALRSRLQAGADTLDLAAVRHSDSAGLSCVLAVMADAATHGRQLAVRNVPEGMRALARVCAAESLLT